uniref:COesterase domain-containing protein n=1 Tax=Parastrongyloides trichosuri TaxID=131310 RepID=A0A0N4ZPC2_PARTI
MKLSRNICLCSIFIITLLSTFILSSEGTAGKMTRIQHVFRGLLGEGRQGDITTRGRRYVSESSNFFLPPVTNQILEEPWQIPSERALQFK